MGPGKRSVKGARVYDGAGRQERARRQHQATLDVAQGLFLERGFVATTVDAVASAAGVSAATVYKTYGGKAGMARSLCERALAGSGPVPAEERSNALRAHPDPRRLIEGWGRLTAEVAPRIAPLLLLLRDAALGDAEAAALYEELGRARLRRMADNAHVLFAGGHLRGGLTSNDARDVLWTCSAPELFDLLVHQRRWSVTRYGRFISDTIANALL